MRWRGTEVEEPCWGQRKGDVGRGANGECGLHLLLCVHRRHDGRTEERRIHHDISNLGNVVPSGMDGGTGARWSAGGLTICDVRERAGVDDGGR